MTLFGNAADLCFRFYRTGAGDDLKIAASNFDPVDVDNGVLRMKFSVRIFIGLLNPLDILYNIERFEQINIQQRGVADQAENGLMDSFADVYFDVKAFQPIH